MIHNVTSRSVRGFVRSSGLSRNVADFRLRAVLRTTVALLFSAFAMICHAQSQTNENSLKVTASADRAEVQIADPFQLTIQVTAPKGTKVKFPTFPQTLGPFDVLAAIDRLDLPAKNDPAIRTWTKELTLETIDAGPLEVPRIEITASQLGGSPRILRTDPIEIMVASVVEASADLTKFQDIADLHDVHPPEGRSFGWIWWLVGTGATLAIVAGGVLLFTRSEQYERPASWAIRELTALRDEDFLQSESILRTFIAERFEFPAESYPADVMVESLRKRGVAEDCLSSVSELLQTTERVKFGGLPNPSSESTALIATAQQLVQQLNQSQECD